MIKSNKILVPGDKVVLVKRAHEYFNKNIQGLVLTVDRVPSPDTVVVNSKYIEEGQRVSITRGVIREDLRMAYKRELGITLRKDGVMNPDHIYKRPRSNISPGEIAESFAIVEEANSRGFVLKKRTHKK